MPLFADAAGKTDTIQSIGIVSEYIKNLTEEEPGFQGGIEKLTALGFDIREVSLPDFNFFRTVHHIVGSVEASSSCGKYDGVRYATVRQQQKTGMTCTQNPLRILRSYNQDLPFPGGLFPV